MIKAILMVYVFVPFLVLSVFTQHKEVIGLCMAVAFACGKFAFYFINSYAKQICNNKDS